MPDAPAALPLPLPALEPEPPEIDPPPPVAAPAAEADAPLAPLAPAAFELASPHASGSHNSPTEHARPPAQKEPTPALARPPIACLYLSSIPNLPASRGRRAAR